MLVRELAASNLLRRAFFLWDNAATATAEGLAAQAREQVNFYAVRRRSFAYDLLRQTLRHPGDLWLCTHVNYALLGYLTSWCRRRRVGVMLHAAELDEAFTLPKRIGLRRVGQVFAVSEFTKKKAVRLGVRPERVTVLYNSVDDPCPDFTPRGARDGQPTILFVGRMDERYKGQMELLDAMVLLRRRLPDLRLVFIGGGSTLGEWKDEARRRDLSAIVEFRGRIAEKELSRAYEEATLFAMPSHNEGFGLVYAEAMAHGLPCIGSDRDAAREVIENGKTGLCVPAGNSTALADALQSLLRSADTRASMGTLGRQRFLANFTAGKYRERLNATMADWRARAA